MRDRVDLRNWDSPVESQLDLGSCSSNALASAYELLTRQKHPEQFVDVSRLFLYYNIRFIEGTIDIDSGAYMRDGIKAIEKYGLCAESLWPYKPEEFATPPPQVCYDDAKKRTIKNSKRLDSVNNILDALNNNYPVVFGMAVYNGFGKLDQYDAEVKMPLANDVSVGSHAMCIVGYDLPKQLFLVKNSFGTKWGDHGYCLMPFNYIRTEAYDVWTFDLSDQPIE